MFKRNINIEEAKKYIIKKIEECFCSTSINFPNMKDFIWDKQAIRTKKLLRISNKDDNIDFEISNKSIYLFIMDYDTHYFFYHKYLIHKFLIDKYQLDKKQVNDLIKDIIKDDKELKNFTPVIYLNHKFFPIEN